MAYISAASAVCQIRAQEDFNHALRTARFRKVVNWLLRKNNDLLPLDEVLKRLPIRGQHYRRFEEVPIDKIVGSEGRCHDFDRAFFPLHKRIQDRWVGIDKVLYSDATLPPVELYKIGDAYFVRDGNHRVSVARERGQTLIEAYVTELNVPISITADTNISDLLPRRASGSLEPAMAD